MDERLWTLRLNDQEMALLNEALIALPFRAVAPLINKITEQLLPQKDAAASPNGSQEKAKAAK